MARNIPNGSTATKDFPEPPAVVAPGSSWTVRHEADFTAFSNHDFELIGDPAAYQDIVVDGGEVVREEHYGRCQQQD